MNKRKRGRPTKITNALTKRICALLAKGSTIKSACILSDVGERTYHDWMERGQNGEEQFASFFSAATRAREQHKARLQKIILDAAEGMLPRHADWRAAAWSLEKGWPLEYGDRRPLPPPVPTEPSPHPSVSFVLAPSGRQISFTEAEKIYCNFPIIERQEGHEADAAAAAKETRDFERWERYGVLPNLPDNGGED